MKYIIEFEDEPYMREDGVDYYTCKSARWYKLGETIINRLTPYTEPDLNPLVDEAVEIIENEVWEFVGKLSRMKYEEIRDCFGIGYEGEFDVLSCLTYSTAKARYEEWMKQKDEIHVGDEVTHTKGYKGIVTYINCELCDVLWDDGCVTEDVYKKEFLKTGRHFDEVADLLEKMKGDKG